jgi:sortase A
MTSPRRKFLIGFTITFIAVMVFMITLVRAVLYSPESEIALPSAQVTYTPSPAAGEDFRAPEAEDQPSRLVIPSLHIDAHVQKTGIAKSGNMAPPTNFTDVGWYRLGTVPGFRGSAVMAGHVDNALALAGVFKHLPEIKKGADIYVKTGGGESLRFKVTDVTTYSYKEVPTELIFNQNDKSRLRLITCGGNWIQSAKSYDERVVVTAELMG